MDGWIDGWMDGWMGIYLAGWAQVWPFVAVASCVLCVWFADG